MDIIHALSNLEIETTHSSSQDSQEVKRNWLELPPDVMSLILMKLDTVDILGNAQWVCTSWWKLSKQPQLFRSISMHTIWVPFSPDVPCMEKTLDHANATATVSLRYCKPTCMVKMVKEAVDRSCGQLVQFSVIDFATDELLYYLSQKSESLRCLRLACCMKVTDDGLTQVCKQFPHLEELELYGCWFSEDVFETVGCLCPYLKSFRVNYMFYTRPYMSNGMALVIAEAMPELRHLNLFGNRLTDVGLRAILGGCSHLQSLDLRRCFNLKFEGDLKEMSANMKLRLPYDSTDDFEYPIESFSEDELCYYVDE